VGRSEVRLSPFKLQVAAWLHPCLQRCLATLHIQMQVRHGQICIVKLHVWPMYLHVYACLESKAVGRQDHGVGIAEPGHHHLVVNAWNGDAEELMPSGAQVLQVPAVMPWSSGRRLNGDQEGAYLHPVASSTLTWIFHPWEERREERIQWCEVVGAQWISYPLLAQALSPLLHGCTTGNGLVLAGSIACKLWPSLALIMLCACLSDRLGSMVRFGGLHDDSV
jgi:hypothetical protein